MRDVFFCLNDRPFGKSYSDWTAHWWKSYTFQGWRRSMGPAFMLPGKMVESEYDPTSEQRSFKISHNKGILLSIINWLQPKDATQWNTNNPFILEQLGQASKTLTQLAIYRIDLAEPDQFNLLIDQKPVPHDAMVRERAEFDLWGIPCASDGYWLFLKPDGLGKGKHNVSTFGTCTSGRVKIAMDYEINIS